MKLIDSSKLLGVKMHDHKKTMQFLDKLKQFNESLNVHICIELFGVDRGSEIWPLRDHETDIFEFLSFLTIKEYRDLIATINSKEI